MGITLSDAPSNFEIIYNDKGRLLQFGNFWIEIPELQSGRRFSNLRALDLRIATARVGTVYFMIDSIPIGADLMVLGMHRPCSKASTHFLVTRKIPSKITEQQSAT